MKRVHALLGLAAVLVLGLGLAAPAGAGPKIAEKVKKYLYDGEHPLPDGTWCKEQGLHFHAFPPSPSKAHYKTGTERVYKLNTKRIYWVCGKHPLDSKTLYEKNDRHWLPQRPKAHWTKFRKNAKRDCWEFPHTLTWICGPHPLKDKGRAKYTKNDRHYVVGKPGQWPSNYTKDNANNCYRWKPPELDVVNPSQRQQDKGEAKGKEARDARRNKAKAQEAKDPKKPKAKGKEAKEAKGKGGKVKPVGK